MPPWLGWSEIDVLARHDLANDPVAAARWLPATYRDREQLDFLDEVRVATSQCEIERDTRAGKLENRERGRLRARHIEQLAQSGRNIDRYLNPTEGPQGGPGRILGGRAALTRAAKVGSSTACERARIAVEIRDGSAPVDGIAAHMPEFVKSPAGGPREFGGLMAPIARSLGLLEGHAAVILPTGEACSVDIATGGNTPYQPDRVPEPWGSDAMDVGNLSTLDRVRGQSGPGAGHF